ncbi:MAG: zinc-dependent peptidase [Flavipsychrobacter sp.]
MIIIFMIFGLVIIIGVRMSVKHRKLVAEYQLPKNAEGLLQANVSFYRNLNEGDKLVFKARIKDFLANVAITGVDTEVEDIDRILIASGAIIPIFSFRDWRYNNISEVLLYKDTFNKEYDTDKGERNILGMVGDGALHREMILSKPSVRSSFANESDGHNTVIHEFVHLLDKADGAVDGVPEYLLTQPYIIPWIKHMHETIQQMRTTGHSDINLYGATNDAEFFAVIAEYFFERPHELQKHHPELYAMLEQMFHPH